MTGNAGNPAAMRAAASTLRMRAEALVELSARLRDQMEALEFDGPAASEFRVAMLAREQSASGVTSQLNAVADEIIRSAAGVEEQQLTAGGEA